MPNKDKVLRNAYMRSYMNQRYETRMQEAIVFLGNKCVKCGKLDNLEFDHIDQSTKLFSIGKLGISCSYSKFWNEVNKCQLLCKNCHKLKHASMHGTRSHYINHKCRCVPCVEANRIYNRNYKRERGLTVKILAF